jgi:hypothetical protein
MPRRTLRLLVFLRVLRGAGACERKAQRKESGGSVKRHGCILVTGLDGGRPVEVLRLSPTTQLKLRSERKRAYAAFARLS